MARGDFVGLRLSGVREHAASERERNATRCVCKKSSFSYEARPRPRPSEPSRPAAASRRRLLRAPHPKSSSSKFIKPSRLSHVARVISSLPPLASSGGLSPHRAARRSHRAGPRQLAAAPGPQYPTPRSRGRRRGPRPPPTRQRHIARFFKSITSITDSGAPSRPSCSAVGGASASNSSFDLKYSVKNALAFAARRAPAQAVRGPRRRGARRRARRVWTRHHRGAPHRDTTSALRGRGGRSRRRHGAS